MTGTPAPSDRLSPDQTAFFLDVDGTLTDLVADPAKVRVAPAVRQVLQTLQHQSQGAVAVISGRSIAQLDMILHPLRLPCVGVHGLEARLDGDHITRLAFDGSAHATLAMSVMQFADNHKGLEAEPKPGAVALHYRKRPELAEPCLHFMQEQVLHDPRLSMLTGKMVVELIFGRKTKGDAITALMQNPPFAGRQAFFAGDDVTDEAGFRCVNDMAGISVKIGDGETCAQSRLPDPGALAAYLARIAGAEDAGLEHLRL